MAIQGEVKQATTFTRKIGIAEFEVLGVNLQNEKLKELGFYINDDSGKKDLFNDREFVSQRQNDLGDEIDTVMIEFALKEVTKKDHPYFKRISFFIGNQDVISKSGLTQYINDQGLCSYVDDPSNLKEWFSKYQYRKAFKGEEVFMKFMRACMKIDFGKGGTLSYNIKKFFSGNFKELQDDLKNKEFLQTVLVPCTIKIKDVKDEDTGETVKREYESFFKAFAPGGEIKLLNNKREYTENDVLAIQEKVEGNKGKKGKDRKWVSALEQMIYDMSEKEYGCKDIYHLGILKEYNSEEHLVASDKVADIDSEGNEEQL